MGVNLCCLSLIVILLCWNTAPPFPCDNQVCTKQSILCVMFLNSNFHRILPEPGAILEGPGAIFSYEVNTLL